jgi:signal transduction histidine kinase
MGEWILPTLSQVLSFMQGMVRPSQSVAARQLQAEHQWTGAIAALETLLETVDETESGLVLSGPFPILSHSKLLERFKVWAFTADPSLQTIASFFQLPPSHDSEAPSSEVSSSTLPLLPGDPIAAEHFCLVLTAKFSLVMVLGEDIDHQPGFWFSFDPDEVSRAWQVLRLRVVMLSQQQMQKLDAIVEAFPPVTPSFSLVSQFSQTLLSYLPPIEAPRLLHAPIPVTDPKAEPRSLDVELLTAIAHEVRTPLTTIRTLTRLLMKRKDMSADALKRLEVIDRECSDQIDRFGIIFRAVELETSDSKNVSLTSTCLNQVLSHSIPRWQQQASQRGLVLNVVLPDGLPSVVSDPMMLDQALTSLIERSARSLPSGSKIQVEVSLAGDQLKLQVETQPDESYSTHQPLLQSLGEMLTFQPETGVLSLNLAVTKNLFQAIGGKLTVKERSAHHGEVFTLFLPLLVVEDDRFGPKIFV